MDAVNQLIAHQAEADRLAGVGDLEGAVAALERAVAVARSDGELAPDLANLLLELARVTLASGRFPGAAALAAESVAIIDPLVQLFEGPEGERIRLSGLIVGGHAWREAGRYVEAIASLARAVDLGVARFGDVDDEVLSAIVELGIARRYRGEFHEAEAQYRQALTRVEPESEMAATLRHNLGGLFFARGEPQLALPHARAAVEIRARLCGPDAPATLADEAALAPVMAALGDHAEARRLLRRVIAWAEPRGERYEVAVAWHNLGASLIETGDIRPALDAFERAFAEKAAVLGEEHPDAAISAVMVGAALADLGETATAAPILERAVKAMEAALAVDHPDLLAARRQLARAKQP